MIWCSVIVMLVTETLHVKITLTDVADGDCVPSRDRRLVRSVAGFPHSQHVHQARSPVRSAGVFVGEGRSHTLPPGQKGGCAAREWGDPVGILRYTETGSGDEEVIHIMYVLAGLQR